MDVSTIKISISKNYYRIIENYLLYTSIRNCHLCTEPCKNVYCKFHRIDKCIYCHSQFTSSPAHTYRHPGYTHKFVCFGHLMWYYYRDRLIHCLTQYITPLQQLQQLTFKGSTFSPNLLSEENKQQISEGTIGGMFILHTDTPAFDELKFITQ